MQQSGEGVKILLVEDHATTNRTLAKMLERRGYTVTSVGSGAEAEAALRLASHDVAVCDIGLPDTSGWALYQQLRRIQPGLRGLAVTGRGYPDDLERSATAGFDAHLVKPVTINQVDTAILTLMLKPVPEHPTESDEARARAARG